jgi:hypothetical protein
VSFGERETIDFLASMTAEDLWSRLRLEAKDVRAEEWKRHGGFDGALVCAPCDSTPATCRKEEFPRHDHASLDGCHGFDLDFHASDVSKRTGWTLTLREFCLEGKWTRFGCWVFEVVRLAQLSLVGCAESVIWLFEQCGGVMLSDALARGVEMAQRRIGWASSSCEALESLESFLRARVLKEAFEPAELGAPVVKSVKCQLLEMKDSRHTLRLARVQTRTAWVILDSATSQQHAKGKSGYEME